MIEKMMNKGTFHIIDGNGKEITKFEVDLLEANLKFKYGGKYVEMFANNIRYPYVLIKETKEEIETMYAKKPKKVKLRNTTEIISQISVEDL